MIDRLEELLAMMEDEDEEEEREDGPALMRDRTVAAAPAEDGGEAVPAGDEERNVPAGADAGGPDRAAGEGARAGLAPGAGPEIGQLRAAEAAWRGLTEKADGVAGTAPEDAASGRTRPAAEYGGETARAAGHGGGSGLEGLYRQAVQAGRPAAPQARPVERTERVARAGEPGRAAALTVDELDRAVKRDSRRYDGGMTIF